MKNYQLSNNIKSQLSSVHQGEIAIMLGDDARKNLDISIAHSKLLASSGNYDTVCYINLPFSRRKFTEASHGAGLDKNVSVWHIASGHLSERVRSFPQSFNGDASRTAIIINSWELASSCYRYREELIFSLIHLAFEYGVSVFVYSTAPSEKVEAGKTNRCGLGKLSIVAESIISLSDEDSAAMEDAADFSDSQNDTTLPLGDMQDYRSMSKALNAQITGANEIVSIKEYKELHGSDGHHVTIKGERRIAKAA